MSLVEGNSVSNTFYIAFVQKPNKKKSVYLEKYGVCFLLTLFVAFVNYCVSTIFKFTPGEATSSAK